MIMPLLVYRKMMTWVRLTFILEMPEVLIIGGLSKILKVLKTMTCLVTLLTYIMIFWQSEPRKVILTRDI